MHLGAAEGFKQFGLSNDLWGREDNKLAKEAAEVWNEQTTDGFAGMRQWDNNELPWARDTLDSTVEPYEPAACDAVLQKQGDLQGQIEDFDPGITMADEDSSDSGPEGDDADVLSPPAVPVDGLSLIHI